MRVVLFLIGVLCLFAAVSADAQCTYCMQRECQDDGPHRFCDVIVGGCASSGACMGRTACGREELTTLVARVEIVAPPSAPNAFELAWRQQFATPALIARMREPQWAVLRREREQSR